MAIFNNGDVATKSSSTDSNTTIITAGAKITGEVELSCNLYIDGELEGSITSSKEVNVGKNGHVKGNIVTNRLVVQGYVEGSVEADRVEIKAAGHVNGEITSIELVIESKGVFEGNSIVKNSSNHANIEKTATAKQV
ncbi:polymer-forming cytoskeletal family protein [Sulfurimonas paralvinellae]|uniref:Polymer-forming cytoskeletal family protein n=1 Tax=Sulfurimonas paralvinellae TaxID=317658 RepID=A0A7M1B611_9BACT|nr:polymer-forming cytoskeletal family protein [Sulfurimonas paralvinellae]